MKPRVHLTQKHVTSLKHSLAHVRKNKASGLTSVYGLIWFIRPLHMRLHLTFSNLCFQFFVTDLNLTATTIIFDHRFTEREEPERSIES